MEPQPVTIQRDDWMLLVDPGWKPVNPWSEPPPEAVIGGWMMDENGGAGPFQPNPGYLPGNDDTPTDPTDALLRSVAEGKPVGDELLALIRNSVVEIVCDEQDQPMVDTAPDGVPCVLVVTAEAQKVDVGSGRWWPVLGSKLPAVIPSGTDILLNPGGPAPFRLASEVLRNADRKL
ncbi:type VII secretion system-associated protein [Nocardia barduliensis]|uniref:type VII secretion system-associated protein n=1 Tax=Nocardia barduliensis TaxID=2736643 RepID=UPI001FE2C0B2|nr:type VII secretion system-associated protein [Nocardia barduliensis]